MKGREEERGWETGDREKILKQWIYREIKKCKNNNNKK